MRRASVIAFEKNSQQQTGSYRGFVVLSTANLGLALVLLSLEISGSRTREHVKKFFLKAQISTLQQLQEVLSQAASHDLQIFNRFREIPGRAEKKGKPRLLSSCFLRQ